MGHRMKPSRFLFNTDFSAPEISREAPSAAPAEPEVPMLPLTEHEKLVRAAEERAFERGLAKGRADAAETAETRLSTETANLAHEIATLIDRLDIEQARHEKNAVALSFLAARRICAHLIAREPLGEIVALISDCLGPLRRAPHLVIRVRETDVEALKARLDPLVHEKGFEGRLVILGEPDLERGDCRIEWADGGLVRDRKTIERQIDQAAKRYFEAKRASATTAGADAIAKDQP